ncbi:MAG: hypothetical protein JOZ39_08445, partial [Chloroflexi bacterium]|nr:hypothetical protein [Chloroflexota bacterium]
MRDFRPWAALLRLAVGATWLFEAYPAVTGRDIYLGEGFARLAQGFAAGNPWHFYVDFLNRVVIPHAAVFSYLTLVGNALIGICLVLGLLTPYACGLAMLLNVNYALAQGWQDRTQYALNGVLFVAELAIIGLAAGRIAGLDGLLGSSGET